MLGGEVRGQGKFNAGHTKQEPLKRALLLTKNFNSSPRKHTGWPTVWGASISKSSRPSFVMRPDGVGPPVEVAEEDLGRSRPDTWTNCSTLSAYVVLVSRAGTRAPLHAVHIIPGPAPQT
jgi:hypothetical protein